MYFIPKIIREVVDEDTEVLLPGKHYNPDVWILSSPVWDAAWKN